MRRDKIILFRFIPMPNFRQSFTFIEPFGKLRASSRSSFTLIELLVVLAIVAILATVVVMTLNPVELLRQARDSNRLSDLNTINTALGAYTSDTTGGFTGTSSIVYVSIADTTSTCANLGLPTLPSGWSYNCVTSANLKKTDGQGWIPVNFQEISFGTPISSLPIDPTNTTSSRNYYTYVTGGSYELTASLEAAKNKLGGESDRVSKDGGTYPSLYEAGTNLALSPLDYGDSSLVGYWNFEEGPNATSSDRSGFGNHGTWVGNGTHYAAGRVGSYGGSLNGVNDYVYAGAKTIHVSALITISFWTKSAEAPAQYDGILGKTNTSDWTQGWGFYYNSANTIRFFAGTNFSNGATASITPSNWNHVVGVVDGTGTKIYVNNVLTSGTASGAGFTLGADVNPLELGRVGGNSWNTNGDIDDVRIYNRAFSAAEISALYNATR